MKNSDSLQDSGPWTRRERNSGRVFALICLLLAASAAGCGSATKDTASSPPSTTKGPGQAVRSVAHAASAQAGVNIKRVVLVSTPVEVTATFTTYNRLERKMMTPPFCGQVGLHFPSQQLNVLSSSQRIDSATKTVPQSNVMVTWIDPRTIRLRFSPSVLGKTFNAFDPWRAFSSGPQCPPMGVSADVLPLITPKAHG
jgi:hypothetical protein